MRAFDQHDHGVFHELAVANQFMGVTSVSDTESRLISLETRTCVIGIKLADVL